MHLTHLQVKNDYIPIAGLSLYTESCEKIKQ